MPVRNPEQERSPRALEREPPPHEPTDDEEEGRAELGLPVRRHPRGPKNDPGHLEDTRRSWSVEAVQE